MRVALLSDIHANLVALEAALVEAGPVDAIWHLGDVVGYGPHPREVVARLQELGAVGVRGNHDVAALGGREIEAFNVDARRAMEWTRRVLDAPTRAWLSALPERLEVEGYTLVHGSPRDPIWEYVVSGSVARASFEAFEGRCCLHGHTHVPVVFRLDGAHLEALATEDGSRLTLDARRVLLNPGSVGQPRDGDPRASFVLLDTSTGEAVWRRVAYAIEETQAAMRAAGLPAWLIQRLELGF